ncbi:hypothetical protein ABZ490_25915 [Streptomyces sp. NPDC005811]|uniref:hypothetical protein n=1 Tax=Streptomyces sp. NPDC005811 TaxID=3154565 RepID=UPI0033DE63CC
MITLTKKPRPGVTDEQRITALAAAVYVASQVHAEALKHADPAATLDDIADALPEVMPEVFQTMGTAPDVAAVMLPEVTDRVWAYTVIEHARADVDPGYRYVLDILVDGLKKGGDPATVRADVRRIGRQLADLSGGAA